MTDPTEEPVRYHESGSTWWPLVWGPAFCGIGFSTELITGPAHWIIWFIVAVMLLGLSALWVSARRMDRVVTLTDTTLRFGTEVLAVDRIARIEGVPEPEGGRALGGGFTIPHKTHPVPLELVGGSVVLGWARFSDDLVEVLVPMVDARNAESATIPHATIPHATIPHGTENPDNHESAVSEESEQ